MVLDLSSLEKSVQSLDRALAIATSSEVAATLSCEHKEVLRAGVIQNFEFTYELCWKFMKRWLENNLGATYVDGVSRKDLFRLAAEQRLIENIEGWMEYHYARNLTAHTYNLDKAQEVFLSAQKFIRDAKLLLNRLIEKND